MDAHETIENILHKIHQESFGPRHLSVYQASKETLGTFIISQ